MTQSAPGAPERRVWAAVAFKGSTGGKRRLAALISESERGRLTVAMLDDVLDVLLSVKLLRLILLVTADPGAASHRSSDRLRVVHDDDSRGLNGAFEIAQRGAAQAAVTDLLLLPADLPIVSRAEIDAVLRAGDGPGVVLTPDRAGNGTNALLLRPPTILAPSFGEGSFERHRRIAAEAGLSVTVVRRPRLALDLDTPDDVAALLAGGLGGRTRSLLLELGVDERLDAVLAAQARSATI